MTFAVTMARPAPQLQLSSISELSRYWLRGLCPHRRLAAGRRLPLHKPLIFRHSPLGFDGPGSCDSERSMHQSRSRSVQKRALGTCLLLVWLLVPTPSWAYRPFISTDAAVAAPKEVEIELGYFTLEREKGENSFIIPRVVLNYGLFKNWEAVAEFAVRRSPDGELNVIDSALFAKGVLKEGVLQDKEGLSIAVEVGPLLPSTEKGERNFGFEGVVIFTDKLGPFMFHLNGGLGVQRSTGDIVGIWGVIGEFPVATGLRLVGEVNGEKPQREEQRNSALLGLIWQPWSSKNVWFDAGVRRGFTRGVPDWQFTFGVTFGFSGSSLAPSASALGRVQHGNSDGGWR
jgi:hypothetical protein